MATKRHLTCRHRISVLTTPLVLAQINCLQTNNLNTAILKNFFVEVVKNFKGKKSSISDSLNIVRSLGKMRSAKNAISHNNKKFHFLNVFSQILFHVYHIVYTPLHNYRSIPIYSIHLAQVRLSCSQIQLDIFL